MSDNHNSLQNHITRFDGSNFQLWKFQMKNLLFVNDLLGVVDGTRQKPVGNAENDKKEKISKFLKDDARAKVVLMGTTIDKQAEKFIVCDTSKEIWDKLSSLFEQKSENSKLHLLQKFHSINMSTSESVMDYMTRVQNVVRNLKDIGEKISEAMFMAKILGSLPRKFDGLVIWDSVPADNQTMGH